ncbi:thioredoxin domain-containing protein [Metallosphaera hakonensis]|uniref:Thioredoxin domain-containing protein n=1 Tax=Metallosphaera hakonensis JCM 8857 = DSM 7519 TaxID=1293036 RepID=A0A2U9IRZ0_9CREN|nr:thioredoxin domain-containing protein [Metallosphaera hakonensis]AWR98757.1 DUF255 domain-containing protein [Metallosphaera hakonensis JCM 8857 = DSM 7519]
MNRLANSSSAFLRESANQKIDWYPWSDEAFQRAKQENKPILVDVGAVWCHWCHVMDEETYSREDIAEIVNQHFVAIKVDRDEMPDLDRKLQRAVTSLTGESGWPLTVFMTPEGEVFFGGTFFPPEDSYGRVGMKRLLKEIVRIWSQDRDGLKKSSISLTDYSPSSSSLLTFDVVETTFSSIVSSFDIEQGGLGTGMKFPHPMVDRLMASYSFWTGDQVGVRLSTFTLRKMFQGGIFDQIGGGFHRYAVDREWNIPHFEKLLVDNAELLEDYFTNYLASADPQILEALDLTVEYILRDMWTGEGFASSMDADVDGKEGGYYTWDWDEFLSQSGNRELAQRTFTLVGEGALEGGVVRVKAEIADITRELGKDVKSLLKELREMRERLRTYRDSTRRKPYRDDNLYTYPNCRVADSLLLFSVLIGKGKENGLKVLSMISKNVTRRLKGGGEGLLEDYASALLLSLRGYEVTGDLKFRDLSVELGKALMEFMTSSGFVGRKGSSDIPNMDTPNESPNSLALRGILSLSLIHDEFKVPEQVISSILGDFIQGPSFYAGAVLSAGSILKGLAHVVVVDSGDAIAEVLHREALLTFHPFIVVERVKEGNRDLVVPLVRSMINQGEGSRAFVCVGNTCSLPVKDVEKIKLLLKSKVNK